MTVFSERPLPDLARDGSVLPEGWADVLLEEIVVHAIGGEWGEDAEEPGLEKVNVIRGKEFRDWARERGATAPERWVRRTRIAKRRLQVGDIIVEISGGGPDQPVGRTLLIDEETLQQAKNTLLCSNFCRLMRIHPAVDPAFVQLALLEKYLRGEISDYQTQTTNLRNLVFKDFLAGTVVRLPPLAEQGRIVERVEELFAQRRSVRERLKRVQAVMKRFRVAVLTDATSGRLTEDWRERSGCAPAAAALERVFAARRADWEAEVAVAAAQGRRPGKRPPNLDPEPVLMPDPLPVPEVPEEWSLVPLRDVIRVLQYGTSVKSDKSVKNGAPVVPVLRMGNIQNGAVDLSDLKVIARDAANLEVFRLRPGDILFNRTNSPELVGKAAVFEDEREMVFASYLVRIGCDERLVASPYVCAWINSPWGRQWARAVRRDCINQSNINASKLQMLPVPLPPLAEQEEIVRRMAALFRFAEAIERRLAAALAQVDALPRTVLERAMRGELVPTEAELARDEDREYEPAARLVERVLAGREEERWPRLEPAAGGDRMRDEEVLAAFRQACWGAQPMPAEDLFVQVELRLHGPRAKRPDRARLEALLETAVERRIVAAAGGTFTGATPKFGRYDDDDLLAVIDTLLAGGLASDRRTLSRAVAAHLGYSQLTGAMRDRMEEVFTEGLRRGRLAMRGGRLFARPPEAP
ncbi:MAG TPA: restriction endonuclease subunit S [Thermoanaerobaculia bacterium]|nr:restriction endonuclease subunit S [Thermoanaerobaculia bacterium]